MNKLLLYLLFFTGLIISSIFYTFSSYYFRLGEQLKIKFEYIYIISIVCGIISYLIKVPVYYYFGKDFNILTIHVYFLVITFSLLSFYRPIFKKISPEVKKLLSGLLQIDPVKRFSASECLNHDWITGRR